MNHPYRAQTLSFYLRMRYCLLRCPIPWTSYLAERRLPSTAPTQLLKK